jgi:hypothetical protein
MRQILRFLIDLPFNKFPPSDPVDGLSHDGSSLDSRLKRLHRLIVSLPDAAATTAGNDGGRSGIELTPSDDTAAIGREHRLENDAHHD